MESEIFKKNLKALQRHVGAFGLIMQIQKIWKKEHYLVEPGKKQAPTLSYLSEDGAKIAYHSRYDPVQEAKKQADSLYDGQTHVLALGFGLGYLAEEINSRIDKVVGGPQLFVVEPDPGIFMSALLARDLTDLLNDHKLVLLVGMSADQIGDYWNSKLDWTVLEKLAIIDHPPSMKRFMPFFERVVEKIRYLCNRSKGNLVTLMHAGYEFHTNNFANLSSSFTIPGIARLFGKFKGCPVIIVAAGPSLDKNMHLLKEIKGRFPILAVDTALRQLVANGVKPDIVCAADPSYENSLDFVGVENELDVILAVEPMTHPDILECFNGPKMTMTFGGGLFQMMKDYREPVGKLACWGSIATTVFDFAKQLGCDPLVFIGLDLSFADGRLHAKGSYSDDIFFEKVHPYTSIEQETVDYINTRGAYKLVKKDGSFLFTDQNMKLYRDWFEDQFRQTSQKVINATEGGVVDKYCDLMPLSEVIKRYYDSGVDVKKILDEAVNEPVKADIDGLIKKMQQIRMVLRKQESEVKKQVGVARRLVNSYKDLIADSLSGPSRADFFDLLKVHDEICDSKDLFPWFSIHQAKFMTRHTMEINSLKANKQSTVGAWLEEMGEFFKAITRFHEYQIPLLEEAISSLNKAGKQTKNNLSREVGADE